MRHLSKFSLAVLFAWLLIQEASALIAGSYNVRFDNPGDVAKGNPWPQRVPVIAGLIRFNRFDILGTQEGYHHQVQDLQKLLPDYSYVGCGRNDGKEKGEYAAIFYRKDKFILADSGTFWLSETPEKPSKGWDADLPRICTWAKLKKSEGGGHVFVFNTHFDHRGKLARVESAKLILRAIKNMSRGEPVILTGDFNVDQNTDSYREIHDSGVLADAFETAKERYALNGTANAFNPNSKTESRIDHVFHSPHFKTIRYGVLTDTYRTALADTTESKSGAFPGEVKFRNFEARLPSDHFPVLVEFE